MVLQFVTITCIVSVAVYSSGASPFEEFEDIIALGLVCLRYVVPIVQLILWFYNGRHRALTNDEENSIMFSRFGLPSMHNTQPPRQRVSDGGANGEEVQEDAVQLTAETDGEGEVELAPHPHPVPRLDNANSNSNGKRVHRNSGAEGGGMRRPSHLGVELAMNAAAVATASGVASDSDDSSYGGGRRDMLERVLVTHLHATKHHGDTPHDALGSMAMASELAQGGMGNQSAGYNRVDSAGGDSEADTSEDMRTRAKRIQSPFVVGKQMAAF